MKRFTAILLAIVMCLNLLAGCGNGSSSQPGKSSVVSKPSSSVSSSTSTPSGGQEEIVPAFEGDLFGTGAVGENGAAACASEIASQIAVDIMKKGGNAVDAAVAMIYAVGMLEPAACGIGGAGQMVVYLAEKDEYVVIEYMTQAPKAAIAETLDTSTSDNPPSPESIAIPGVVHGTLTALEKYGTMTPAQVLEPVIKLARKGFPVTARWNTNIEGRYDNLAAYDYTLGLYTDEGFMWNEGDIITNKDIADTYQLIADQGIKGFYDSEFTDKMVAHIKSVGGVLTREDFAQYTSVIREPVSTTYRGYTVYTVGGPSNGGTPLLEMLNILEHFDLAGYGHDSAETVQIINDAYAMGYQDGITFMADPDYYDLPVAEMISKDYAAERMKSINVGTRLKVAKAGKLTAKLSATGEKVEADYTPDQGGTSHMVVMDSKGNVVSSTNTNGINFGSAVAVPGTGFVFSAHLGNLNNADSARINKLMPYIRVRTTICPTIVADETGKPVLAVGSPGNWALVPAALNTIINMIDFDMNVAEAVLAPRSYRDGMSKTLTIEPRYSKATLDGLEKATFELSVESSDYGSHVGCVAAIEVGEDGKFYAIGDYRRMYGAAAY